jgi:hypothetical protein
MAFRGRPEHTNLLRDHAICFAQKTIGSLESTNVSSNDIYIR